MIFLNEISIKPSQNKSYILTQIKLDSVNHLGGERSMAKKSKTSFKKMKKPKKDINHREEYSKEFNQVIHNNPPLEVRKHRGT